MGKGVVGAKKTGLLKFFSATTAKEEEHFDGFYTEGDLIYAESREVFAQDPYRMMRVFQHAQQRHLRLSPELQQLIRRGCNSWGGRFSTRARRAKRSRQFFPGRGRWGR